jgi:hypothetical protein
MLLETRRDQEVKKIDDRRAAKQQRIARELAGIGFALPGSLTVKAYRCGKQNCGCKADPPKLHGPYAFWTRKVDGKTVTRMLSDDEVADYGPLFENSRKLRALIAELQELSLGLVEPPRERSRVTSTKAPSARTTGPQRSKSATSHG